MKMRILLLVAFGIFYTLPAQKLVKANDPVLDFLNLKFGMFIHYNTGTYHAEQWAYPFHDPKDFKPSALDCNQWASAAKSAGMQYAVFTTKHHDGFCLWDTKVSNYDIASAEKEYKNMDIVKEYVDAFRKADITVGLYFSVWDRHHGIQHGNINEENIAFTKQQLSELLTNYGEIACIVIDGWGSKWGNGPDFKELPYATLADHIHSIQPNCLVINHSCRTDLSLTQLAHYEATHGQHCPFDNTVPSQQGPTIQPAWFWEKHFANLELKSVEDVKKELNFANTHYANYLLNAAPNDKGLMDDNVIERLKEIGKAITLSEPLTELPKVESVHKGVKAKASSYNGKEFAPTNVIDANLFTRWQYKEGDKEPWLELDFGSPQTFNKVICGEFRKGIEAFKIEALVDGKWVLLTEGKQMTFNYNRSFPDVTARKYKLTILKASQLPKVAELTFVKY
ncbi:alpha-L-fucosidase [Labilibacter marinus]|uniref:alpha-L-fucosidase n=1 Tax=Labilibacter marinus TaxID=1477105 RepID=UPI000A4C71F6|nr:alpha-L-fucosidase [Labilibacter marinus]